MIPRFFFCSLHPCQWIYVTILSQANNFVSLYLLCSPGTWDKTHSFPPSSRQTTWPPSQLCNMEAATKQCCYFTSMEGEQTEIDIKQLFLLRDGKRYDWASKAVILWGGGGSLRVGVLVWFEVFFFFKEHLSDRCNFSYGAGNVWASYFWSVSSDSVRIRDIG